MSAAYRLTESEAAELARAGRLRDSTGKLVVVGGSLSRPMVSHCETPDTTERKARTPNKTEARYAAEVLEPMRRAGEVRRYDYEPERLRIAENRHYVPDWRVVMADGSIEFHEVKAGTKGGGFYSREVGKVKIDVAAALHPYRFVIVWPVGRGWGRKEVRG